MLNSPEYVLTWLGLAKIGVIVALINHNLKKTTFAHCLNVSNASAVIFDLQLLDGGLGVHGWKIVICGWMSYYEKLVENFMNKGRLWRFFVLKNVW